MNRTDIINALINKIDAKYYLEIGVANGVNFDKIICQHKIGVDPNVHSKATVFATSDNFFNYNTQTFDMIFIDGLHHEQQVYKDIVNALSCLNHYGYIVCHDMLPPSEEYQIVPPIQNLWTGDSWKAWVKLRSERTDLQMYTIDTDYGCGIISKGQQLCIDLNNNDLNWHNFTQHKKQWMNIISISDFKQIYL